MLCNCQSQAQPATPARRSSQQGNINSRLYRARRFFLDFPTFPNRTYRVSDMTRNTVLRVFDILRMEGIKRPDVEEAHHLLRRSPATENLSYMLDNHGWTLLQRAILLDQPSIVDLLLTKGVDVNAGACSPPLHLACKIGLVPIVEMLLDFGSRVDVPRSVCYGVPHHMRPSCDGKPPKFRCHHIRPPALPYKHALQSDQVEVLKLLLNHKNSRKLIKTDFILHEACQCKARQCIRLLVGLFPDQVNVRDKRKYTPLQYTMRGRTEQECGIILLESDAVFAPETLKVNNETVLHQLYSSKDTVNFLRLTKVILEKGPPDLVSVVDDNGNNSLHTLLKFFTGEAAASERDLSTGQVVECIKLLLKNGCNPNHTNKKGQNALHALLSHHGGRPLLYSRVRPRIGSWYLNTILGKVSTLMEVLLENGADVNAMSPPNLLTPLYYLIRIIGNMNPTLVYVAAEDIKTCIGVLIKYGADPNVVNMVGDNALSPLLSSLSRWFFHIPDDKEKVHFLLVFIKDILRTLLMGGLDAKTVLAKNLKQFIIIFNINIPDLDEKFIECLNELIRTVICFGGDPNSIQFSEQPLGGGNIRPPTKYSIAYYLARGFHVHWWYPERRRAVCQILKIFHHTLNQSNVTSLIALICGVLENEFEDSAHNEGIALQLRSTFRKPRTLKDLARLSLCTALQWKVDQTFPYKLPLPKSLISYVVNIE